MSEFKSKLPVDENVIRAAYKFMLRREPDSLEAVEKAVGYFKSVEDLEQSIRESDEWRQIQLKDSLNASSQKITKFYSQRGYPIYLDLSDTAVSGSIWLTDHFEPHVEHMIVTHTNWDEKFIDVGANIGWFTIMVATEMRKFGSAGDVDSFEPNSRLASVLAASIIENSLIDRITLRTIAISDQIGVAQLYSPVDHAAGGKILDESWKPYVAQDLNDNEDVWSSENHARTHRAVQSVPTATLDDLYRGSTQKIGTIKFDIEGHEPLALKGAIETLKAHKPKLIIEIHPPAMELSSKYTLEEFLALINQLNYSLFDSADTETALDVAQTKELIAEKGYSDFLAICNTG